MLIGSFLGLWIAMLIHAVVAPIPDKIVWILVLVFMNTLGAVIYYFKVYYKMPRENQAVVEKRTAIVAVGLLGLIAFITVLTLTSASAQITA